MHTDVYHFHIHPINHNVATWPHPAESMLRNVTCIWIAMSAPETLGWTEGRKDVGVQQELCHRQLLLSLF